MSRFAVFFPLLLALGCGSGKPAEAPSAPETEPEKAEAPAKSEAASSDDADKPDAKPSDSKPSDSKPSDAKPSNDGPKPTRSAQDILTAPDTMFIFSFNDSDVKQAADTKCSAASGNDAKKMNTCMAKARKGIEVDGYRFKQKDGKWWWLTIRTNGKVLTTLHKFEIEFAPEKEGSVTIKPKGKDLGSAPGRTPGQMTFAVPNEYQIVVNDAKLGKLVYEAKIGIASE